MDTQPTPQNPGFAGEQRSEVRPEAAGGSAPETHAGPNASELSSQAPADAGAAAQAPANAAPTTPQPTQQPVPNTPPAKAASSVTGPLLAGDVDVIEPEWVDKAEQVIKSSQGDPYSEEEAVEDLQRDYLKKRYGHDVEDAGSDTSKPGVS